MNDLDPFETELKRLAPAKAPEEFISRMTNKLADLPRARRTTTQPTLQERSWPWLIRWLAPAMAIVAVLASLNWRFQRPSVVPSAPALSQELSSTIKADNIEIDRHLVGAFDAVARLPDGEPVRFRCREWADNIVLRDSARGITIERRTPRLEVIPISLETY